MRKAKYISKFLFLELVGAQPCIIGQKGTLEKVKRISFAFPQVLAFWAPMAIGAHVTSALDGETK